MSTPRAIRIPRAGSSPATGPGPTAEGTERPAAAAPTPKVDRRYNQAALERARRLLVIYLGTLIALYVAFLVLDRSAPGGTSATAGTGLLYFSGIAAVLGVGGIWIALSPAPRAIEVSSTSVVVVSAWARRHKFPPLDEIRAIVVRRFPRSILASRTVEVVEVTDSEGRRRTYQIEEGLLPTDRPRGR